MGKSFQKTKDSGKKKNTGPCYYLGIAILLAVFLVSAFQFGTEIRTGYMEHRNFEKMATRMEKTDPNARTGEGYLVSYAHFYQENPDFEGWLHIPDTKINLPVMYTPEDPEYYLHRDFQKKESKSGTLFLDEKSTEDADCRIIYGHNMKNKTMFGSLEEYLDPKFWKEHKTFSYDSLTGRGEYEVFSVVKTQVAGQDDRAFRYDRFSGKLTDLSYRQLVGWFKEQAVYDTGILPEPNEPLLLLSTCSYHTENGRLVVAARKVQ